MADLAKVDVPRDGLPNDLAIQIARAVIKRFGELTLEQLDKDLALVSDDKLFESLISRAKWQKFVSLLLETNKIFKARYCTPRGELQLLHAMYGDQLDLPLLIEAEDVRTRLAWYRKRVASDFEERVTERISAHEINSPIEQLFLLEWTYQNYESRLSVELKPQWQLDLDGQTYFADFFVTNASQTLKMAIELDGHDFHEKTKQQAVKDKARERLMIRHGIVVVRFTGSELVRDPRKCVREVADIIENQLRSLTK